MSTSANDCFYSARAFVGLTAAALCCLSSPASAATLGVEADLEVGVVAASRNDVRIPGDTGTRLSLSSELSSSPTPVFRFRLGYRIADRHLITALYAPLQLVASGSVDRDLSFAGATFAAGSPLLAVYRFDSYRLTYRYSFVRGDGLEIAAGLTGKIRDAEISLHGAQVGRKKNTGFVPLVNLNVDWKPGNGRFGVLLDVDALAAPQGRAEDILVAATWTVSEQVGLRAGYRMVEGGAGNEHIGKSNRHFELSG